MSVHINAPEGAIADKVLLPGDPLRAKYIAETFLEGAECYNTVRSAFGYTGTYKGKRVSVQATGMGQPSAAIYINELIQFFHVKKLFRIGSCGAMQPDLNLRDLVVAISASTDSHMNLLRFKGMQYAATADAEMLFQCYEHCKSNGIKAQYGPIFCSDTFYGDDPNSWKLWAEYNTKAVDMETSQLYTLAAKYSVQALSILTVSDSLVHNTLTSSEDRERSFSEMVEVALNVI